MKFRTLLAFGLLTLLVSGRGQAASPAWPPDNRPRNDDADSPYVPAGYHRTFTENFTDAKMVFNRTDNPKFTTGNFRLHADGELNTCRRLATTGERELFFDQDFAYNGRKFQINPFSITNGVLSITANPLSDDDKNALAPLANHGKFKPVLYSSGMLSTETDLRQPGQGFDQLYGYWELRARLPKGKGLWPAFWLVNENWHYWNEIDVFEVLGDAPRNIYQSTHLKDGGGTDGLTWPEHTYTGIDPTDGFHVYGLRMTVDKLFFTVDGKQTLELAHKLHDRFYTILSLAVGGDWPKDPDATTKFPASFDIDYLRIYQQPD